MRYRIELAYLGTPFHGWQFQHGVPTIQGALREALQILYGESIEVLGCSRTDAGVHARGQVASFAADERHTLENIYKALNFHTPPQIAVQRIEAVRDDFHPRHASRGKWYRYRIQDSYAPDPFNATTAAHIKHRLDADAMHAAAQVLVGEHDFSSFRAAGCEASSLVKQIRSMQVQRVGRHSIQVDVRGSSFLKYMVRNMVGSLIDVGRGRRDAVWLSDVLEARDRTKAGATAPPEGLTLEWVDYPEDPWTVDRRTTD
jgi:tRNA pseudouridine38-40 synthase